MEDRLLWKAIERHPVGGPGRDTEFLDKLAKEAAMTRKAALRALSEYLRFAYLSQVSEHRVVPSGSVDQVWHLHLQYTRDYWEQFCGRVLRRPLHHHPEPMQADDEALQADYALTRALYEREFGHAPPRPVWPRRLDTETEKRRQAGWSVLWALVAGSGFLAIGWSGLAAISALLAFLFLVYAATGRMPSGRQSGGGGGGGGGCGGGCGGG